ncbi:MAG: galactose mutarotase [Clostridia bacterium]|nr:galactose mutarotase [Clostridia bacterium]
MVEEKLLCDGTKIYKIWEGMYSAEILTYGAILKSLFVPDKNGKSENIVCGFDTVEDYRKSGGYFGAAVGRVCNRIGNSRFVLDGKEYILPANDGKNHLHGGPDGFSKRIWEALAGEDFVELSLVSPDGDMGYPGNLKTYVRYTLKNGKLTVDYTAETDKPTPVNMTNHSYFDICGAYGGRTTEAELKINAREICLVDKGLIPTGELAPVSGTPYDFTASKPVGRDIDAKDEMLRFLGGYDTNYFIDGKGMREAAVLSDPVSGRKMTVLTDQPCVQLYTANSVGKDEPPFSGGVTQSVHSGICLETQAMPDVVNHPEIMDIILRPGEEYHRTTVFDFNA